MSNAVNATNAESLCPERRPVLFTEDGQRQIPQELYNMATQVCKMRLKEFSYLIKTSIHHIFVVQLPSLTLRVSISCLK